MDIALKLDCHKNIFADLNRIQKISKTLDEVHYCLYKRAEEFNTCIMSSCFL